MGLELYQFSVSPPTTGLLNGNFAILTSMRILMQVGRSKIDLYTLLCADIYLRLAGGLTSLESWPYARVFGFFSIIKYTWKSCHTPPLARLPHHLADVICAMWWVLSHVSLEFGPLGHMKMLKNTCHMSHLHRCCITADIIIHLCLHLCIDVTTIGQ